MATMNNDDFTLCKQIASRASLLEAYEKYPLTDIVCDLSCAHTHIPLDLKALLKADPFTFAHDLIGITTNLNRNTFRIDNCFVPRTALPQPTTGATHACRKEGHQLQHHAQQVR